MRMAPGSLPTGVALRAFRGPAGALVLLAACARPPVATAPAPVAVVATGGAPSAPSAPCVDCGVAPSEGEVLQAVASRVADLKLRGGACQRYGEVLEGSLESKRIVVRPFMWRVGTNLASAQALSSGEIDVARDVDLLNIGRRSLDEVVHSVEHEAAHIAFGIPSGTSLSEVLVDARVSECRGSSTRVGASP